MVPGPFIHTFISLSIQPVQLSYQFVSSIVLACASLLGWAFSKLRPLLCLLLVISLAFALIAVLWLVKEHAVSDVVLTQQEP